MSWQYNGIARMDDILEWCYAHIHKLYWWNGSDTIHFHTEDAKVMFLLKWS